MQSDRRVCVKCARPVPEDELLCPTCDSAEFAVGIAQPTHFIEDEPEPLPFPWSALTRWPDRHLVLLSGGPGAGKSTLAAELEPDVWLTTEQSADQVGSMFNRLGIASPYIVELAKTLQDVQDELKTLDEALEEHFDGLIVLDSVTQCGNLREQEDTVDTLVRWVKDGPDRRVLALVQHTKDGKAAGLNKLAHMADADVSVSIHNDGLRAINMSKNRAGRLQSMFFELGPYGLEKPSFPFAYSVEGRPGSYRLDAYPDPRARWQGIIKAIVESGDFKKGIAGAANIVAAYESGLLEPNDVEQRRKFAESHGLTWVNEWNVKRSKTG